jgi:hypothetical protein
MSEMAQVWLLCAGNGRRGREQEQQTKSEPLPKCAVCRERAVQ